MSKQNDDLIYKLTWMLNDEKSPYKQQILEQAIDALTECEDTGFTPEKISAKTIACGNGTLTVEDVEAFGPQWHDAKKELPNDDGLYLCYVQYGRSSDYNEFVLSRLIDKRYFSVAVEGTKVLYWMPIPSLKERR